MFVGLSIWVAKGSGLAPVYRSRMLVRRRNAAEVGWFGSKLVKKAKGAVKGAVKGVSKGVKAVGKVAAKVPGVSTALAPVSLVADVAKGRNVIKSVRKRGGQVVADTRKALPVAATVVSFVPGAGTAVSAGLRAGAALSEGKSIRQIAEEAALGAVPGGHLARAGLKTAIKVGRGKNVLRSVGEGALEYGEQAIGGGELAKRAFAIGKGVAKGQNVARTVGREAVSYAKSQVPAGISRTALEAATKIARGKNVARSLGEGAVQVAAERLPGGELTRRVAKVGISAARGQNVLRAAGREAVSFAEANVPSAISKQIQTVVGTAKSITPRGTSMPLQFGRPSYGLPPSISPENVRRIATTVSPRRPQLGPVRVSRAAKAAFRPLSMGARSMLVRALPHMRGEVSGLSESGTEWIVESGDTGSKIAQKLTGNPNRWTELRSVNPKVMGRGAAAIKKYGFPIYVGDRVILPSSWIQVVAKPPAQSAPATPSQQTAPPVQMPAGDIAAQGQARTILAAWGRSDGVNQPGVVRDYGGQSELLATAWTSRDVLQGGAFADWWKANGGGSNLNNGYWSDELARALNTWAERKASQVTNTAMSGGGIVIPSLTGPPAVPVPAAVPPTQPTPVAVPAPAGSTPAMTLPVPQITLPQVMIGGAPVTTSTQPAPTAAPATQQAATAATGGLSDNQKWAFGSVIGGSVASALIRAIWA